MITVAATPYGRLATTLSGGGSSVVRSSLTASPMCSVVLACGSSASRERGLEAAVELDDVDVARAFGEVLREHAEAAADLEHDVVVGQLGGAADHVEDVRVDEEVLAEVAVRADAELAHPSHARLCGLRHQPKSLAALAVTAASSSS